MDRALLSDTSLADATGTEHVAFDDIVAALQS